ncbi:MAG: hypothetical protein ACT452_06035 [Microthrixaceae bacterium]
MTAELEGQNGFSATVDGDTWRTVGSSLVLRRRSPPQRWDATVVSFTATVRCVLRWTLASGQAREAHMFKDLALGDSMPLRSAGKEWTACVVERRRLPAVTVEYRIKSGARRQQVLYVDHDLPFAYFRPLPDGGAEVRRIE